MDRMYDIFEHELAVEAIPYKDLFEREPFKGYLFEEFRFAELKPCPWLYREKFISNEEYCNAEFTSEFRNRLSQIQNKFYDERINNSLEQQFFCPDLMKTPIAAILKKIKDEHEYFKKDFNDNKFDIYVESISNALNSISKIDLRNEVAEKLIADDFSIYDFDKIFSGYPEWGKRKLEFNHLIKKSFQDQKNLEIQDEVEHINPEESKKFDFTKILQMIKFDRFEKAKPKFKECLSSLGEDKRFHSINNKEFAAIAFLFYKTNWINNDPPFTEWLNVFSESFNRLASKYKPNQLREVAELMERKFPYLVELPIK